MVHLFALTWQSSRGIVTTVIRVGPGPSLLINSMNVGICQIKLRFPGNLSLKGKRRILKSITTRVKNRFNVSIAEVDDHDLWQLTTLGICCVSNSRRQTNEVLSKVVNFVTEGRFDAEILDYEIEILSV